HSRQAEESLHQRLPRLLASGIKADWLDRDAMLAQTGLPSLYGGIRVLTGGSVNPLAYARGLARAAAGAGVRVFGDSPVVGIEKVGSLWRVRTATGEVVAPRVVMTTNALIGNILPKLRASIVPARVFQIATQVMPDDVRKRLLPAMAPVA